MSDLYALAGSPLTEREMRCLSMYCELGSQQTVADRMGVSLQAVKNALSRAYRRLRVPSANAAFHAMGWVMPPTFHRLGTLPYDPDAFARWVTDEMAWQGLSGRELAQLSGIDHTTISRLRRGFRTPGLETAIRIARALHATGAGDSTRAVSVFGSERQHPVSVAS